MRKLGILIGGALVLASCAQRTPPPPPDMNNVLLAPGFLAHAASANQFEIQSSQLALQSSQNAGVRNLANVLIADHTQRGIDKRLAAHRLHSDLGHRITPEDGGKYNFD